MKEDCMKLSQMILESNYTVVLTGAGMSTESGIPDFRSREGIWRKFDPEAVASVNAMKYNYKTFHEFYSLRDKTKSERKPNIGHYILADWEKRGYLNAIVTQNVDGFHKDAGSKTVYEIHGSIKNYLCMECNKPSTREAFIGLKECEACGGRLRPGIVLFGEMLPELIVKEALESIKKAELVIIIGTSLRVYPAANMHSRTSGKVVYINDVNESNKSFDLVIIGKAGEVLKEVDSCIISSCEHKSNT